MVMIQLTVNMPARSECLDFNINIENTKYFNVLGNTLIFLLLDIMMKIYHSHVCVLNMEPEQVAKNELCYTLPKTDIFTFLLIMLISEL